MTHRLLTENYSALRAQNKPLVHHMKLYSLFKLIDNRWNRVRTESYSMSLAYRVWGLLLVDVNYSIRPIKLTLDKAQGITHFGGKTLVN